MTLPSILTAVSMAFAAVVVWRIYMCSSTLRYEGAFKRRVVLVLRTFCVLLLLAALFDLRIPVGFSGKNYIVLIDNSWSMKDAAPRALRAAGDFFALALEEKDSFGQYISFGSRAAVEKINVTRDRVHVRAPRSSTGSDGTDLGNALSFASAMASPDSVNGVVLMSDGDENLGDYRTAIGKLRSSGIPVFPVRMDRPGVPDMILSSLTVPPNVVSGQKFEGKAVVELSGSEEPLPASLRIYRDDRLVGNFSVTASKGFNTYRFQDTIDAVGFSKYTAFLEFPGDRNVHNNSMHAFADVGGPPKILLVSDKEKQPGAMAVFSTLGFPVESVEPGLAPASVEEFLRYKLVVLNDVEFMSLRKRTVTALKSFVTDLGGGLMMLGGDKSFGNGGYMATPLEDLAPVTMDVTDKAKVVSCAIVFVIDKSGSMSENSTDFENDRMQKINLAKEAVIASIGLLFPKDLVGVIAFDSDAKWIVPMVNATDKGSIQEKVSELFASGGTSMYGALEEAFNAVRGRKVTTKHIIALTDGITTGAAFDELVAKFKGEKITLSTVALGRDADVPFLEKLSRTGGGRFYFSEEAASLVSIFVQETLKSARNLIVEEIFVPAVVNGAPVMNGLSNEDLAALPKLRGYVATTIKPNATLHMRSPKGDPVFATMQCGLGKTCAMTFDLYGRWGGSFVSWDRFPLILKNTVRHLMRSESSPNISHSVERKGDSARLEFRTVGAGREFLDNLESRLLITAPDGTQATAEVAQTRSGTYSATYRLSGEGTYFFSFAQSGGVGESFHTVFGYSYPYSREFVDSGRGRAVLDDIAASTGGRVLTEKELSSFRLPDPQAAHRKRMPIRDALLRLAMLVFLAEIFLWRVDLSYGLLTRMRDRVYEALGMSDNAEAPDAGPREPSSSSMGALLGAKKKVSSVRSQAPAAPQPSDAPVAPPAVPGPSDTASAPSDGEQKKGPGDEPEPFTKRLLKIKKK